LWDQLLGSSALASRVFCLQTGNLTTHGAQTIGIFELASAILNPKIQEFALGIIKMLAKLVGG
jgi:hypothetical protein